MKLKFKNKLKQTTILLLLIANFTLSTITLFPNENRINELSEDNIIEDLNLAGDEISFNVEWRRIWTQSQGCIDIAVSSSEDIYVIGEEEGGGGYLLKYDKFGNLKWDQYYDAHFCAVTVDALGNAYIAAYASDPNEFMDEDINLLKYNKHGVYQWRKIFDKNTRDEPYAIALDNSNNIYVGAVTYEYYSYEIKDILVIKCNPNGVPIWDRILDIRETDECRGIALDSLNNIYICGWTDSSSTSEDVVIAKYNNQGTIQWYKIWGGSPAREKSNDIVLDSSNNIYITGESNADLLLIKFDNVGTEVWNRKYGADYEDVGYGIDLDNQDNIYIAGMAREGLGSSRDTLFLYFNSSGSLQSKTKYIFSCGTCIVAVPSKNVYIGGWLDFSYRYFHLIKYNPSPKIIINSPAPYSLFIHDPPSFNVTITDNDLISTYYKVNDGLSYSFTGSNGTIEQDAWDTATNGTVSLKFFAEDRAGAVYEEVIVRKDILGPIFEIVSPEAFQPFEDLAPDFELAMDNMDYDSTWYTLNSSSPFIVNTLTGTIDQASWDSLDNGTVNIQFFMNDSLGNIAMEEVYVYKNHKYPIIKIHTPLSNQIFSIDAPSYNISVYSIFNIDSLWYSLNDSQGDSLSSIIGKLHQTVWDTYGNGTLKLTFYANNTLGNTGHAEILIHKDIYFPLIEIYSPRPNQLCGIEAPRYNISISSVNLDFMWYTLNNDQINFFIETEGIINQTYWDLCNNGRVTIIFYANNSHGQLNFKEVKVQKDANIPNITILSPAPNTLFGIETIHFNLSINAPNLDTTWYSLNGGLGYIFTGNSGTIDQTAWELCGNGTVTISFYANNTAGNIGLAEVSVRRDIYFPFIQIYSPSRYQLFGNKAPQYNISVSSYAIDSMCYSLNDLITVPIYETFGVIAQTAWDMCINGTVKIVFFVNNTYGQINFKEVIVLKDTSTPLITILKPVPYTLFGIETIDFEVSIIDPNLETAWYTLNGGINNFFTGNTGLIDQTAWELCGNGTVTISFYANNTIGNIEYAEVVVHRDIYFPFMDIYAPSQDQITGLIPPKYNISVSSLAIDFMWYTLNHGDKVFFTNTEGAIDQSKWELFGEDTITISFYANNSFGQMNTKEITIEKITSLRERNAYAIIIGISDYPGTDYDLSYCDDDAIAVYNMLINDYNFKPENIIYLQDSSATRSDIDGAFNTISSIINPNDIFYFYFSGHGGADIESSGPSAFSLNSPHPYPNNYDRTWSISSTDAAYMRVHFSDFQLESGYDYLFIGDTFITIGYYYQYFTGYGTDFWSDWIPVLNDNSIYLRMITDSIITDWGFRIDQIEVMRYSNPHYLCSYKSIPDSPIFFYVDYRLDARLDELNCDNKYVILDSCNSGGMIPESQDDNRFIMTACKAGQFSIEEPALNHGIFTYYLLNSLDNANDQNGDGVISMEECFSYVSSGTRSYSASYGPGVQYHPQLYDGIEGQSVLYTSIGSLSYKFVENRLYYSFYLYGTGNLNTLNITFCSILPEFQIKTVEIKDLMVSYTGFGFYSDYIELNAGYNVSSFEILCEVQGNELITLKFSFGDTDGDGLTDVFEISNGLNPFSNDTDSDGLTDGDEVNIYHTNPLEPDTDFDGLLDYDEIFVYNTDPLEADTDSDGLSDSDEIFVYNTDPLNFDTDSDGLSDGEEVNIYGTDPLNDDTDSDDLSDGDEINIYTTNPLSNDTDSDNLSDGDEVNVYFTNPLTNDTDTDGLLDGEEIYHYFTNPNDADTDNDGFDDGYEIRNNFDPNNPLVSLNTTHHLFTLQPSIIQFTVLS